MIDPAEALAFNMQANRGVYAVLIGSGVSRSAGIPTGWDITLDLVSKLADLRCEATDDDPEGWYRETAGKTPEYDDLLNSLNIEPVERQQLLRPYFEANEQESEEGLKQPTAAHRAIAELASRGFIKVIITTNFDHLMENALKEEGIVPMVLSSDDQIQGAPPLAQMECCVLKLHGDYLDTRIRNTTSELQEYSPEINQILDRVFDEYGLIVCGWSAKWDVALRSALLRCPCRRYTTYWAHMEEPSDEAQTVISHRKAQMIDIEDADSFFSMLRERVQSLEEFSRPHPLSTEAAVASLKRYLPESRHRIRLDDLVDSEVDRVLEAISIPASDVQSTLDRTKESVTARVRTYEAACSTLLAMAATGGAYAEEYHFSIWGKALQRLSLIPHTEGNKLWLDLQNYPANLLLYTLGLGAVSSRRLQFLQNIFSTAIHQQHDAMQPAVKILPTIFLTAATERIERFLEDMEGKYVPLNDWIHDALRQYTRRLIPIEEQYDFVFDKLETLLALSYAYHNEERHPNYWTPVGAFLYRHDNRTRIIAEIKDSIDNFGDESPFVRSNIFGESTKRCLQEITRLEAFTEELRRYFRI